MLDPPDRARRTTFDEDAELYDRVRPGYPAHIYDDLGRLAGIGPGARVLEIGAGTGKATVPLAARGYRVVAVELGANMAAVARRNLSAYPDVEVVESAFETWPLPPEPFDAVVVATAFHWLDPAVRVAKAADALRPGGSLAVVETHHVAGGTTEFFQRAQACYLRFDPETPPDFRLPTPDDVPARVPEMDTSDRFEPPVFRRYAWEVSYSTAGYLDLLMTYSNHRVLPTRTALLECIGGLIDERYGGRITKCYLTQLWVSRRR